MSAANKETDLFRKAMLAAGVKQANYAPRAKMPTPHKADLAALAQPGRNKLMPKDNANKQSAIDNTNDGPQLLFARHGVSKLRVKQLRRGDIVRSESIDLHGMRSHAATNALAVFFEECIDYGYHCIEIIHGKGNRSEQSGGVLKPMTIHWLKQQQCVAAFCSATGRYGGSGATWVLLG